MLVQWVTNEGEIHNAERVLRARGGFIVLYMQVESLGESGWDWHVWDMSRQVRQQYGLADTLAEAKRKAEAAAELMTQELGLTV